MSNKLPVSSNSKELEPITRSLSITEKIADAIGDRFVPEITVPVDQRFAKLTLEQKQQLEQIEERAFTYFKGQLDELESALGMLRMGHHMGWKVLYLIHSKKTIRKYEEILQIKVRDIFPDEGPSAKRSVGLNIANKFSNFWKAVSGEVPVTKEEKENRRKVE
ncbi:MAG TPA: hypothetical protein VK949_02105 [Methylotenera sp.]|nr:hypothetical protein [Methylotenera sp.]